MTTWLRDDLVDFAGYSSARSSAVAHSYPAPDDPAAVWLNANESPVAATGADASRRYPSTGPGRLRAALAGLYAVAPEQVLVTRGSDEAIDVLVRGVCSPGAGAVVTMPPTFGMYAVAARLHGAQVVEVPLVEVSPDDAARDDAGPGWALDLAGVLSAADDPRVRLVFLCSPGNPTGHLVPLDQVAQLARALAGRALLVVDEAYVEYAQAHDPATRSATTLLGEHDNLVVLRTLSKAHALAGARVGCLVAGADLVAALGRVVAPYPLATPAVDEALSVLTSDAGAIRQATTGATVAQTHRLRRVLLGAPGVHAVYRTHANFVLARFADADRVLGGLLAGGIVVRDLRADPRLGDALRLSAGTPEQVDAVARVLAGHVHDPRPGGSSDRRSPE